MLAFLELYTSPEDRRDKSTQKLAGLFPEEGALLAAFRACDELRITPRLANDVATYDVALALREAGEPPLAISMLQFQRTNQYWYLLPSGGNRRLE